MSGKNGKEKSGKKSGGFLVEQPHGGAIRYGSEPGNTPGTGRPPSELRARMRGSLEERLSVAEEIADNPKSSDSDRLRAIDFLAKYGLGTKQELTGKDDEPLFDSDSANDFTRRVRQLASRK